MYFYEVRYLPDLNCEYPCYQHPDPGAAIAYFNTEYGPKVGKQFTAGTTKHPDADYILIEQQKPPLGSFGLRDLREISLYKKE
jgi:hypothetical protein